jgi:FkbM family methyltransferase
MEKNAFEFRDAIIGQVVESLKFNTFTDNYDSETFDALCGQDNSLVFQTGERIFFLNWFYTNFEKLFEAYQVFSNVSSRDIFKRLICYRLAGHHSFRIGASYTERKDEYEKYALAEKSTASELAVGGMFGNLRHYDFEYMHKRYVVDCLGLEYYLHRRQYFYEREQIRIMPEEGDFLIDGGACLGDSTSVFSNAVGIEGKVYAFDPVADHLEILKHNAMQFPINNVEVVEYGLSNKNIDHPPLRLNQYNPAFQSRALDLPLVKIDSLVENKILSRIDFIKLDVEGSEVEVLQGAQRSISIFQPKMAISLYHKPNDLFEIPLLIRKLFPFYSQVALDHYSIQMGESVFYVSV